MKGYTGRVLIVDLSRAELRVEETDALGRELLLGGAGLAAWYFQALAEPRVDPLGPENPLVVMTGPLTGTALSGTGRFAVGARSPLTGLWGEANCGGSFGPALKFAGFDGVVVTGRAETPQVLWIEEGRAWLEPASDLWGKDTYETTEILWSRRTGRRPSVFCIGPAGENGILFASIQNDKGDAAGRTGMGAVMGSKRLKAMVARGSRKVEVARAEEYSSLRKEFEAAIREAMVFQALHEMGTDAHMELGSMTGDVPCKNWTLGEWWEGATSLSGPTMVETILVGRGACYACGLRCKREVKVPTFGIEGPGPEFETCVTFGTLILNPDLEKVAYAGEICNRLGMDTISAGNVVAFAIEAHLAGLLDDGGLGLDWGNMEAVFELLRQISRREGPGEILSLGVKRAARALGPQAEEMAIHVKGLEVPAHDPRAFHAAALGYAVSPIGASHNQHMNPFITQGVSQYPELGLKEDYDPYDPSDKAQMIRVAEDLSAVCNSAVMCVFVMASARATHLARALEAVVGGEWPLERMMATGARSWYLRRSLSWMMGARRADDTLPRRLLTPLSEGGAAGKVPDLERMLRDYYSIRGLDESGRPRREILVQAGLDRVAGLLYQEGA